MIVKREIQITADGSSTIHLPDWNENYHSTHGAIQEAKHVFLKHGLAVMSKPNISVLEIGFGTGLNCFLTVLAAEQQQVAVDYVGVEAFPVTQEEVSQLNYISELNAEQHQTVFEQLHVMRFAGAQPLKLQHREEAGEADREGREDDVKADSEGELNARQQHCVF